MKQNNRKYVKAIVNIMVAGFALLGCVFLLPKVIGFFWPFVIGWMIATVANPLVQFLERKLRIKRKASSAMVIIMVLAILITVAYFLIVKTVEEVSNLIVDLPKLWQTLQQDLISMQNRYENYIQKKNTPVKITTIFDKLISLTQGFIGNTMESADGTGVLTSIVKNVPSAIIGVIMMMLSSYCFVAQKDYVATVINQIAPKGILHIYHLIVESCKKALGGYFKAQFQIEVWIYFLIVVGLMILNVQYSLLIALGIAFLDFLPFFGAGAVMWPWALLRVFSGDYKMAIGLMVIWAIGQIVRQILQPRYVGNNVGLSAIPTLFLLYIGYKLGSVLGMLISVPVGILLVNMDEAGIFDNFKNSVKILVRGINEFRKIEKEDLEDKDQHVNKVNLMFQERSEEEPRKKPFRHRKENAESEKGDT